MPVRCLKVLACQIVIYTQCAMADPTINQPLSQRVDLMHQYRLISKEQKRLHSRTPKQQNAQLEMASRNLASILRPSHQNEIVLLELTPMVINFSDTNNN